MQSSASRLMMIGGVTVLCAMLLAALWASRVRPGEAGLGKAIFYELAWSGSAGLTNAIFVQLPPPARPYDPPTLWERFNPFQSRYSISTGSSVPLTALMQNVQSFGRYNHVLIMEDLFREYGHDPAEFVPEHYRRGAYFPGGRGIPWTRASGTRRQVYQQLCQSLTNAGIAVREVNRDTVLLVSQQTAVSAARMTGGSFRELEGKYLPSSTGQYDQRIQLEWSSDDGRRWVPHGPSFIHRHQFDLRLVPNLGSNILWRIRVVDAK